MHVGQTEVSAGIAICQLFVIEAKQVQNRRVQVVHADRFIDSLEAKIVGRTVADASANTAAGHPDGKPVVIVVPAESFLSAARQFDRRGAAELTAPDDERILEQTPLLQVGNQRGNRLIDLTRQLSMVGLNVVVVVPGLSGAVP